MVILLTNFSVSCSSSSLLFASGVAVFIIECGSQRSPEDQTQAVRLARQGPSPKACSEAQLFRTEVTFSSS